MLTPITPEQIAPKPASSHIANQGPAPQQISSRPPLATFRGIEYPYRRAGLVFIPGDAA